MVFTVIMLFAFSFCSCAQGAEKGTLEVIGSTGVVKTYDITVNDTSVNARTVMQKALDYIRDNASEENILTLKLPKGSYGIHSSLNVYSNTVMDLNGGTLYRMGGCGSVIRFGRGGEVSYGYNGFRNVTVRNGVIDGNRTGTGSLIRFGHAYNVQFRGVTIQNTKDVMHLISFGASKKVVFDSCKFRNMSIGEKLDKYNCEAIQMDILEERHFTYNAMDGTRTSSVTVKNCEFSDVQRGFGTHSAIAGYYFDDITLTGNTFKNIKGYAVSAVNWRNSNISDNTITNCGSGITCSTVVHNMKSNFFAPLDKNDKIEQNMRVKIANNTITLKSLGYRNTAYGIDIKGAVVGKSKDLNGKEYSGDFRISGVTIENNSITSAVNHINTYAIRVNGAIGSAYGEKSNFTIKNNKIVFSAAKHKHVNYGLKIENSSKIYVCGNSISDKSDTNMNLRCGIVATDSSYLYLVKGRVTNTRSYAVKLQNVKYAVVDGNVLKNNRENSIYICSGCRKISVTANSIYSAGENAIVARDAGCRKISSNNIYSPKGIGIYITGSSVCTYVHSNYVCDSESTGIYLNSSASVSSISENSIDLTSSELNAISVNADATVKKITKNSINKKLQSKSKSLKVKCKNGISVNSKACAIEEISGNEIRYSAKNAIDIGAAKTKAKITKNKIYSCQYGIRYCKGSLSDNSIKKYTVAKTKKI